jgi:Tat protein translocase TatB subunit
MLGIGMQEILIILVVALIVIGPKRLPELARTLGKGLAEFRKAADDLQETVRVDLQKEKHEEFRQKYPDLVPDEDEGEAKPQANGSPEDKEVGEDSSAQTASAPIKPEPAPGPDPVPPAPSDAHGVTEGSQVEEPEPSYVPEEIEGGDETEDDTRDG